MLNKQLEQQITVKADGQLECRDTTIILEAGEELSRSHHRHVLDVGADVTNESALVKTIASVVHTPAAVAARKLVLEQQK